MFSDPTRRKLGSHPSFPDACRRGCIRAANGLVVAHESEGSAHPKFQVMGLEEGRVAWSLATGKGFFGPFPGYEADDSVARPGLSRSCGHSV